MKKARIAAALVVLAGLASFTVTAQSTDPYLASVQSRLTSIKSDAQYVLTKNSAAKPNAKLPAWVTEVMSRIMDSANLALAETQLVTIGGAGKPLPLSSPTISASPASQSISSGQTATLSVAATGTATLTYQWYVGTSGTTTSPISGATSSGYTTPTLTTTTSYWVRVSNGSGSADSATAVVTVSGGGGEAPCTRTAVNSSQSEVSIAISAASSGDVVCVPAGSSTWTTYVVLSADKDITLRGAGAGVTTLTASPAGTVLIYISNGSESRVTGFTIGCGVVQPQGSGWRFDHSTMTCASFQEGVLVRGQTTTQANPKGLVDHVTFVNQRVEVLGFPGSSFAELHGSTQWSDPLNIGTDEAVYIEDNVFSNTVGFGNALDCLTAGQVVFRNNTVTDSYLEIHSVQGGNRACRKWEIYDNTLVQSSRSMPFTGFLRGGTGFMFRNTMTGTWPTYITVDNRRSIDNSLTPIPNPPGNCDGTSAWDENTVGQNGYRCLDQLGTGGDAAPFNQSARPTQSAFPARMWLNTWGGSPGGVTAVGMLYAHITANRDYYVDVSASCSGGSCSTGIGSGARSSRPSNCTTGVSWWATDQGGNWSTASGANDGALDVCTGTNTWTNAYYTPYTYPHPLAATP